MATSVKLSDLSEALEWVSAGQEFDNAAFVALSSGELILTSDADEVETVIPEDIDDPNLYLPIPHKNEFDLGRSLVFRFIEQHLPDELESIRDYFRRRGAYSRFKDLLNAKNQLDAWYAYETETTEQALRDWCEEHGLQLRVE